MCLPSECTHIPHGIALHLSGSMVVPPSQNPYASHAGAIVAAGDSRSLRPSKSEPSDVLVKEEVLDAVATGSADNSQNADAVRLLLTAAGTLRQLAASCEDLQRQVQHYVQQVTGFTTSVSALITQISRRLGTDFVPTVNEASPCTADVAHLEMTANFDLICACLEYVQRCLEHVLSRNASWRPRVLSSSSLRAADIRAR